MAIEVRPITEAERERRRFVTRVAFALDDRYRAPDGSVEDEPLDRYLAAFCDGELGACMETLPFTAWINGAPFAMGGVAGVACLPEFRRRGLTGAMLHRALADMRGRGQSLSALYTPHIPLYVRYGWEIAEQQHTHTFAVKRVALREEAPVHGSFRRMTPNDVPRLEPVWWRYIAAHNGMIERGTYEWRTVAFAEREGVPGRDLIAWSGDDGEIQGWLSFRESQPPERRGTTLSVREIVALTPAAWTQLLGLMLHHDRAVEAVYTTAEDSPFRAALQDPYVVKTTVRERLLLRVVDLPAAIALRTCLTSAQLQASIAIRDRAAPWNEGSWSIVSEGGVMEAKRLDRGDVDVAMGVNTFATLFNGYRSATACAAAGTVQVRNPAALPVLDALFATSARPFSIDTF